MTATIIVFIVLLAVLTWLFVAGRRDARESGPSRSASGDIDRAELEEAEHEVMEADSEDEVRDWGPGAGKPRPPELL